VVPIGISRIHYLASGSSTPTPLSVTANSFTVMTAIFEVFFEASGFFNVVVYTVTRPALRRLPESYVLGKSPKLNLLHGNGPNPTNEVSDFISLPVYLSPDLYPSPKEQSVTKKLCACPTIRRSDDFTNGTFLFSISKGTRLVEAIVRHVWRYYIWVRWCAV